MLSPRGHLGRVDRLGLASALLQVGTRTVTRSLPRRATSLSFEMAKIAVGKSSVSPDGKDWRFKNKAWQQNPAFHRLGQAYLAWSRTTMDLVGDADLDWRTEERAKLAASLLTSTLAPTNVLPLNPDAIERAYETGGRSVVRGLGNMIQDVRTNRGMPRSVDPDAFVVGRDLGITPGAVVYRNEVCELIQYAPMTDAVRTTPVVLVPPQINKYYFMDMAPGRSLVEYVVQQGFQMFVISWRNPTKEHRQWNLDAYVEAVRDALRATCEITGSPEVNTLALCSGGITTAALLGHLAATGERLIHCATFAVTLLDFSVPSLIGLFGSEEIVRNAVRASERTGVVGGPESRTLFAMLRPNDLIFNYWVANNLLGDRPPAFDVLAWNSDSTRLPAALHADFLDMFLNNSLAAGTFPVFGEPIDLSRVTCDTFVVGARNDHLTDWKACYATTQLLGGDSQFALSSSGHIQSLVNPPGNPKMTVATGPECGPDPEAWLASCQPVTGSWWESWAAWASTRSGSFRPVTHRLGSPCHPAGEPAPGSYVHAT
jgi:polyhydroxyalkanoate synthase